MRHFLEILQSCGAWHEWKEEARIEKSKKDSDRPSNLEYRINQLTPLLKAKKLQGGADKRMNVQVCPLEQWRGPRKSGRRLEKKGVMKRFAPWSKGGDQAKYSYIEKQKDLTTHCSELLTGRHRHLFFLFLFIYFLLLLLYIRFFYRQISMYHHHHTSALYFGHDQTARAPVNCYFANF